MKYIIIPDKVFNSKTTEGAKLLYGLLYSMHRKYKRPVKADNEWLAERMNKSIETIKRHMRSLKKNRFIYVELEEYSSRKTKRLITPLIHIEGQK